MQAILACSLFNVGNRPLKSFRILTVYLTLAALLIGNVAGWVHVGCSSHGAAGQTAGCCSPGLTTDSQTLAKKGRVNACCQHGACSASTAAKAQHEDTAAQQTDPPEAPAEEHDSDCCSICQNFFESRQAVVLASDVAYVELLVTGHEVVLVDDVFAPNPLLRRHTVRGPPSV